MRSLKNDVSTVIRKNGGFKWQNAATADAGRGAGISAYETGFTGSARGNA
jgi:hypothetical protein